MKSSNSDTGNLDRRSLLKSTAAAATTFGTLTAGAAFQTGAAQAESDAMSPGQMREKLQECLGGPFPDPCPLKPELRETIRKDGYRIESISYEVEPDDRVAAHLLIPENVDESNPAPAVAVWHQHNGQYDLGKSEPSGLAGNPMHHTGAALAKKGYVVVCPDALCFEERRDPAGKLKGGNYERFEFLRYVVDGKSMAWKNILDMRRAIDLLVSRPEVNAERIGCYGHSMGSTHAWLVGPLEPRIKASVGNCCLPTYSAIHDHRLLHCFPNFVPGWMEYGDTPEIAALIAPRALHLNLGEKDRGSPIEHAREGIARIEAAYQKQNAADQFSWFIEADTGHVLSEEMWKRTQAVFAKHLRA